MAYSQNDEERVLVELFDKAGIKQGRFLDIGAYDGKTFSNTLRLTELGWSGVCVEPSPTAFSGLIKIHQNNPEIILVNAAISVHGGWLEFYDSGGDALSSSSPEHVAKWSQGCGVKFTRYSLLSVPMQELFTKFGYAYDFINLDVEGLNWELFQALPFDKLTNTKAICVEHDGHVGEMTDLCAAYGFVKSQMNGENLILQRL